MKHNSHLAILLIICLCASLLVGSSALASVSRASKVFESAYVITGDDLYTEFGASTRNNYPSIYVSSCSLQEMDDKNNVVSTTRLTPPSDKAYDIATLLLGKLILDPQGKSTALKLFFTLEGRP